MIGDALIERLRLGVAIVLGMTLQVSASILAFPSDAHILSRKTRVQG